MVRLLWLGILVAGCHGGHTRAVGNEQPDCEGGPGDTVTLDRPDRPGHVDGIDSREPWMMGVSQVYGSTFGAAPRFAVVSAKGCYGCNVEVVRVSGMIDARVPLAEHIDSVDWMVLEDHDGDGTQELWIAYTDGTTRSYVVLATEPLAVRWSGEVGAACDATLRVRDADCDGAADFSLEPRCPDESSRRRARPREHDVDALTHM